jgi:hypothetical protein
MGNTTEALESAVLADDFAKAAVVAMDMASEAMKKGDYEMAQELLEIVTLSLQHASLQVKNVANSLEITLPN